MIHWKSQKSIKLKLHSIFMDISNVKFSFQVHLVTNENKIYMTEPIWPLSPDFSIKEYYWFLEHGNMRGYQ